MRYWSHRETKNATPWVAFAAWTDAGWPGSFGSVVVPVTRQHLGHIRRFPAAGPSLDHANVLGQHDKQASHGERAMRARVLFPDLGRRVTQLWDRLADFVCSDGASIDEAIVRVAFFQTLRLEMESGLDDLLEANPEQLAAFFERFIGECVLERLSQDGGSLLEQNGVSAATAFTHLSTLRAFVTVHVRQRLADRQNRFLPQQIDSRSFDAIVSDTLQEAITAVGEWGSQG